MPLRKRWVSESSVNRRGGMDEDKTESGAEVVEAVTGRPEEEVTGRWTERISEHRSRSLQFLTRADRPSLFRRLSRRKC